MSATSKQPRKKRRLDKSLSKKEDLDLKPELLNGEPQTLSSSSQRNLNDSSVLEESLQQKHSKTPKGRGRSKGSSKRLHEEVTEAQDTKDLNDSLKGSEKSKKRSLSCPTFSKASKLLKESHDADVQKDKLKNTYPTCSSREDGPSGHKIKTVTCSNDTSNAKSSDFPLPQTEDQAIKDPKNTAPRTRSSKSKFPGADLANKIVNYFKPVPPLVPKRKSKVSECLGESSNGSNAEVRPKNANYKSKPKLTEELRNETFFEKSNSYGLFGESFEEDTEERVCYFDLLPDHVLESILCQVPFIDLMTYRLVCTSWNEVIIDKNFMDWKKQYYGLRHGKPESVGYMNSLLTAHDFKQVEDCFEVLLKYMSEGYSRKPSSDMCDILSKNPKAIDAELVLNERFPDLLTKDSKAWCILATAMLLSETVNDVYSLYETLIINKCDCSLHDITNTMYCIATFLLHYVKSQGINHGLHYRAYSALYWIENNLPSKRDKDAHPRAGKGLPGQQSMHNYCLYSSETSKSSLTYEQLRIINHRFQPRQIIKIVALAGTGKTTTLLHLAQLYPQVKFLNVMFNKSVCEYAKKRFPENVTCRTAHSLAYTIFGKRLKGKLSRKIRPHDLITFLQHNDGTHLQIHSYAKHVLSTIECFIVSADAEFTLEHVPLYQTDSNNQRSIVSEDRCKLLKDAIQIWEKMTDKDEKSLKITHDTYLKLYQLSKPKLSGYQCVMVDEAQDCNPAMLDIILSQNLPVILVGDPNQQIYGFRGAKSALQSVDATHTYYLSKSFRFGPEIAYVASCCLEVLKVDNTDTIVGSDKPSYIDGRIEGQYAIIARTNVQLFNEAVRLLCYDQARNGEPRSVVGHFTGGISGYGFDQMVSIWQLASHGGEENELPHIKDKFISKFRSYKELNNYAKSVEDSDLLNKIELVNQHRDRIEGYINTLKTKCSNSLSSANVVFSTAHKSKGLEFDTVCVTDDYPIVPGVEYRRRRATMDTEETNIMYVALTRAKKCLLLPDKMLRVLLAAQEKFEYPVAPRSILNDREDVECVNCHEEFRPHTVLVLARRRIVTAKGRIIRGGAMCVKCATVPTVRPRVDYEPLVMLLDPSADYAHRTMATFVGPLPSDPPVVHRDSIGEFGELDVVYVINLNI